MIGSLLPGRLVVVTLLVVVGLAGCSGPATETGQGETVTPAPVPIDDRTLTEANASAGELEQGSPFDVNAVLDRHQSALANRSYLVVERWNRTIETQDGDTRRIVQTERTWVTPTQAYRFELSRYTVENGTQTWYNRSTYAEGERQLTLVESGDERRLLDREIPTEEQYFTDAGIGPVARFLALQDRSVTERGGGGYRITGTGSNHPEQTFTSNNTATAVVDRSGLVRELTASYDGRTRTGYQWVEFEMTITDIDGVTRPAWANETDE